MQKHIVFILLLRAKYILPYFSASIYTYLVIFFYMFLYIDFSSKCKNLFDQVDKITFFIFYCEDIARVGLIVKDSVIICETIKWVFGTTLFGGGFYLLKTILGT